MANIKCIIILFSHHNESLSLKLGSESKAKRGES